MSDTEPILVSSDDDEVDTSNMRSTGTAPTVQATTAAVANVASAHSPRGATGGAAALAANPSSVATSAASPDGQPTLEERMHSLESTLAAILAALPTRAEPPAVAPVALAQKNFVAAQNNLVQAQTPSPSAAAHGPVWSPSSDVSSPARELLPLLADASAFAPVPATRSTGNVASPQVEVKTLPPTAPAPTVAAAAAARYLKPKEAHDVVTAAVDALKKAVYSAAADAKGARKFRTTMLLAQEVLAFVNAFAPCRFARSHSPLDRASQERGLLALATALENIQVRAVVDAFIKRERADDATQPHDRLALLRLANALCGTQLFGGVPLTAISSPPPTADLRQLATHCRALLEVHGSERGTAQLSRNPGVIIGACAQLASALRTHNVELATQRMTDESYLGELIAVADRVAPTNKDSSKYLSFSCGAMAPVSSIGPPPSADVHSELPPLVPFSCRTPRNPRPPSPTPVERLANRLADSRATGMSLAVAELTLPDGRLHAVGFDSMCENGVISTKLALRLRLPWEPAKIHAGGATQNDDKPAYHFRGVLRDTLTIDVGGYPLVLDGLVVLDNAAFPLLVGNLQLLDPIQGGAGFHLEPRRDRSGAQLRVGNGAWQPCITAHRRAELARSQAAFANAELQRLAIAPRAAQSIEERFASLPTRASPHGTRVTILHGPHDTASSSNTTRDTVVMEIPMLNAVLELELRDHWRFLGDADADADAADADCGPEHIDFTLANIRAVTLPDFGDDQSDAIARSLAAQPAVDDTAHLEARVGDATLETPSGKRASDATIAAVRKLLREYRDVLDRKAADGTSKAPPFAHGVVYSAKLHHNADIDSLRAVPRPRSAMEREALRKDAERRLQAGTARHARPSPFLSLAHVVPKKDEHGNVVSTRVVIDYSAINNATFTDAHPLPAMQDCLAAASRGEFRSILDWCAGYEQIPVADRTIPLTTAYFDRGLILELTSAAFGLKGMVGVFQRFAEKVFEGLGVPYLDDLCVAHATEADIVPDLRRVLQRAREHGVTLSAPKLRLAMREVPCLGHIVGANRIRPDPQRIAAFLAIPRPRTCSELKSWYHTLSQYTQFMPFWSPDAARLRPLMEGKGAIDWSAYKDAAADWTALRDRVGSAWLEHHPPPPDAEMFLATDWAMRADCEGGGFGWVVYYADAAGNPAIVTTGSRQLKESFRQYNQIRGEMHALREALRRDGHLLKGRPFTWITDCQPLEGIFSARHVSDEKIRRIKIELSEFDIHPVWRPRAQLAFVDLLSKKPRATPPSPPSDFIVATMTTRAKASSATMTTRATRANTKSVSFAKPVVSGAAPAPTAESTPTSPAVAIEATPAPKAATSRKRGRKANPRVDADAAEQHARANDEHLQAAAERAVAAAAGEGAPIGITINRRDRRVFASKQRSDESLSLLHAIAGKHALPSDAGVDAVALARSLHPHYLGAERLLHVAARDVGGLPRVVVPSGAYQAVLHAIHDANGHFDAASTLDHISRSFWWPAMREHVADECKRCFVCQRARLSLKAKATIGTPSLNVGKFEEAEVDIQGPIAQKYVITIVDRACRYLWTSTSSSKSAAATFSSMERALANFPWPRFVTCDVGSEFLGEFRKLCRARGVEVRLNAPYNPQAHGGVERRHGVTIKVIAKLMLDEHIGVDEAVRRATAASNARAFSSSRVSPFEAMFGTPSMNTGVARNLLPSVDDFRPAAPQQIAFEAARRVGAALDAVHDARLKRHNAQREHLLERYGEPHAFSVGDVVLAAGAPMGGKLEQQLFRTGPYIIDELFDDGNSAALASTHDTNHSTRVADKVAVRNLVPFHSPLESKARVADRESPSPFRFARQHWPAWIEKPLHVLMPREWSALEAAAKAIEE